MYVDQKLNRIFKWYYFGVSLTNAIVYPIIKLKEYPELQVGELVDGLEEQLRENDFEDDIIANELDYPDVVPANAKLRIANGILNILYYINKINLGFKILDKVLDLDKDEMSFLGIKFTKSKLKTIKTIVLVLIVVLVVLLIIDWKFFGSAGSGRMKKFYNKFEKIIGAVVGVVLAVFGLFFLFQTISKFINGRKLTWNSTNELLSNLGMLLSFSEIYWMKKSLANTQYGFPAVYGGISVLKFADTFTYLGVKDLVSIPIAKFDDLKSNENTLFVYFCGTNERTSKHVSQFMKDIDAKYQIFISGIGAQTSTYLDEYSNTIVPIETVVGNNTTVFDLIHTNREISCIEKIYKGMNTLGYTLDDSQKVAQYAYEKVNQILDKHPNVNKVIFAGHSRGAAVGLSSFAWKLADEGNAGQNKKLNSCDISFFFLDPVSGQTGNSYLMGQNWNSPQLYDKLNARFKNSLKINEIWALASSFNVAMDFNPAKRFLFNPTNKEIQLHRYTLGYTHSGMVNNSSQYADPYKSVLILSPYEMLVKLINEYVNTTIDFKSVSRQYGDQFDRLNKNSDLLKIIDVKTASRLKSYTNSNGETVVFEEFIKKYSC